MPAAVFLSKSDVAYEEIKRRILSDELEPGAVVSQERIATEIGVSTTPVREALKRLKTEGLVRLDMHRDARVTELTSSEARHLYEIRQSIDPLAAELAAQRRDAADVDRIESTLAQLQPLEDTADLQALQVHREFHRAVYRASHNALLVDVLEGLWDKADRYRIAGLKAQPDSEKDLERVRAEHEALARAVIDEDAERARQVMLDHVAHSLGRRAIDALEAAQD